MKVFVKFFSKINLGDDLFLKILFERYPQTVFVIVANNKYKEIFKNYNNVQIIDESLSKKRSFMSLVNRLQLFITRKVLPSVYSNILRNHLKKQYHHYFQDCDAFLSIGGSIFMQGTLLPTYGNIELYKLVNQVFDKVFYIGCNFGPYKTASFKNEFNDIFQKAKDVCFRDKTSWEMFSNLKNVRFAPDIVFNLSVKTEYKIKRSVGFSIISPRNNVDATTYIEKYAELIQYYVNKNYKVFLFSFCNAQGDDSTIETILSYVDADEKINKVFYDGSIENFLSVYSKVEKMYCGRFHAMILSMLFNQKIYPIIYSQKMTNVLNDIGYFGKSIKMEDFYLKNIEELNSEIENCEYDISKELFLSKKQFSGLDELLR